MLKTVSTMILTLEGLLKHMKIFMTKNHDLLVILL